MKHQPWLLLPILVLLLLRVQPLYATALKNLAVLELQPLWLEQIAQVFDPPCGTGGTFPRLTQQIQPSIELGDARALTHLARVQWLEGRCAEAIETWKRAWTTTGDPAAAFELVRVGEYATLSPDVRRSIAEGFYQHSNAIAKAQSDQAALVWLRRSFELMPHHKSAGALANLYRKSENTTAIAQLWREMANALPDTNAEHWWAVAELYRLEGQWEAAARAYTRGAELASEPYEFWMGAGLAWRLARQWDAAIAAYQRAYKENPAAWTCISIGIVYQARGDHANALRWYEEARAKSPQDPEAYYRIGETYYSTKDYALARQYFNEALQRDPDHFLSMYYLAKIYYNQSNRALAEKWMLDALARIPWRDTEAAWWMELGDWRLGWHDCNGAQEAYANARGAGAREQMIQTKLQRLIQSCGTK